MTNASFRSGHGAPQSWKDVPADIQLAARTHLPVLVTAASRDLRFMCARLVHDIGDNNGRQFVTFSTIRDDATVADDTGVMLRHRIHRAGGGTLFIDDVAYLTAAMQMQLFSELEGEHCLDCDVDARLRVIAGASRRLDTERTRGTFCEALYYRLNGVHLDLTYADMCEVHP